LILKLTCGFYLLLSASTSLTGELSTSQTGLSGLVIPTGVYSDIKVPPILLALPLQEIIFQNVGQVYANRLCVRGKRKARF
jgi:hypothetical protein